jgi:pimeloyl-ACP methyl ester carboxylesterase
LDALDPAHDASTETESKGGTMEQSLEASQSGYARAPNRNVASETGLTFAFREVGAGQVPLVLLQHFRGNLDNWDPAFVDELAVDRQVITFDNAGVGGSSGNTPHDIERMAIHAIDFVVAMSLERIDVLGFSIGSFVAQEIALIRPDLIRTMTLASSAPKGGEGMHGWSAPVMNAVGRPGNNPDGYMSVFYTRTPSSKNLGRESVQRMTARTSDRDAPTTWDTRLAQYDAVCAWGEPNHALLQRLSAIEIPVFVTCGDSDPMILPRYSYLLTGLLPNASLKVYPDAAHGFLFQHHEEFTADLLAFLAA